MDKYDLQVMLQDGSFKDFEVHNESWTDVFMVLQEGKLVSVFNAKKDGTWEMLENPGGIDEDLQKRIGEQLKGLRT